MENNDLAVVTKGNDLKRKSEEKEKEVSCLEEAEGILEEKRKKLSLQLHITHL